LTRLTRHSVNLGLSTYQNAFSLTVLTSMRYVTDSFLDVFNIREQLSLGDSERWRLSHVVSLAALAEAQQKIEGGARSTRLPVPPHQTD
jgi:hypothetical protein